MQGFWKGPSEPAEHQADGEANVKFFATDLYLNSARPGNHQVIEGSAAFASSLEQSQRRMSWKTLSH